MLRDDYIAYYEAAWALRARVMETFLATETSLSRVMARFADYEASHAMVIDLADDRLLYDKRPETDPIARLEAPIKALSCGAAVPGFAYGRTDFGGLIADLAKGCDTVVELGSGYGLRLFEAWLAGGPGDARYVGVEPTVSGRDLADRLARLEPSMRFVSVAGDHSDFDPAALGGQRTLVVTCFSLMYAPAIGLDLFRRIAAIPGEVLCLFIEPIGFQLAADDERAARQREVVGTRKLNQNAFGMFNQAVAAGLIEPLFIGRDLFGAQDDPLTYGSILLAAKA